MKLKRYLACACAVVMTVISTAEFTPNTPASFAAGENGALAAQAADTAPPCFYGEKVAAKAGDKHVPYTIYLKDNPGTSSYALRLMYDPSFVLNGKTETKSDGTTVFTPDKKSGPVNTDKLFTIVSVNEEANLIGIAVTSDTTGTSAITNTVNGACMTVYFDIPEDMPEGIYPMGVDCDSLYGSGSVSAGTMQKFTDSVVCESGYIQVGGSAGAPVLAGSAAHCDTMDESVPFSVSIDNNPGISSVKLEIAYAEALEPVLNTAKQPECTPGAALTSVTSALDSSKHIITLTGKGNSSATDGKLFSCYFNIPKTATNYAAHDRKPMKVRVTEVLNAEKLSADYYE